MQPTESLSVPRRPLDVEDYIDILRRHKGWIFGPFLLTLVGSVVGVYLWPDSYESQATVQITPQQVPESLVPSVVVQSMTDRIAQMANTILSRTALTTIIRNFDLYKREMANMPTEDVIEMMRKAIVIAPVRTFAVQGRDVPGFTVSYSYSNRIDAQRVVNELVGKFMDENQRQRSNMGYMSAQFFQDETTKAKEALDEIEARLTQFRIVNQGRLPDQVDGNMSAYNGLSNQATMLMGAISRVGQEKLTYEANLRVQRENLLSLGKEIQAVAVQTKSQQLTEVDREIDLLERNLADARRVLKDSHPDVRTYLGRLENAKARRERIVAQEAADAAAEKPAEPVASPQTIRERRGFENNIELIEAALRNKDQEMTDLNKQLKLVNERMSQLQGKILAAPVGQQEYAGLIREQILAKERYERASVNQQRADASKRVEDNKQGETLQLLDPANLPINPTSPKRGIVIGIGAAVGLLLGVVVAGAREIKDTSLKNLKDVRAYTHMAILGSVPLLENDFVVRRRKRIAWLGWTTACLMAVIVMSAAIVYYYATV